MQIYKDMGVLLYRQEGEVLKGAPLRDTYQKKTEQVLKKVMGYFPEDTVYEVTNLHPELTRDEAIAQELLDVGLVATLRQLGARVKGFEDPEIADTVVL